MSINYIFKLKLGGIKMEERSNPRILYVDSKDCCEMIGLLLYQEVPELELIGISTTKNALRILDYEKFDLFVFEYELPEISGLELCQRIRKTDSETPIVFFTGMALEIHRQIAFQNGVTEYLVKPNDLDKLISTIKTLRKKHSHTFASPIFKASNTIY